MAKHLIKMHSAYKVRTHAFVIEQLGIIQRDPNKSLKEFRKRVLKGTLSRRTVKDCFVKLLSRIQNIALKGSLEMYKWF